LISSSFFLDARPNFPYTPILIFDRIILYSGSRLFNFAYFLKIDNLSPVRFAHLRRKERVLRASAVKGFWEKIFFDCESKIMNKVYD